MEGHNMRHIRNYTNQGPGDLPGQATGSLMAEWRCTTPTCHAVGYVYQDRTKAEVEYICGDTICPQKAM